MSGAGERAVLTVAELSERLRAVVEERFPAVWVEGEISNFRLYASGHAYFTLKDDQAQLRCALFRTRAHAITPVPGGVGPMTVAMLLRNTLTAAERLSGPR